MLFNRLQTGAKKRGTPDIQNVSNAFPAPSSNTDVVKALTADTVDYRIAIHRVYWSYDGNPTGGKLTISGGTNDFEVDIISAGPGSMNLGPYVGLIGQSVTLTLAAGGVGITGRLAFDVDNGVFR